MPREADQLTIDELARVVGMTERKVRAYAARGLLPLPRLIGRTGYYSTEHVEQLSLVCSPKGSRWRRSSVSWRRIPVRRVWPWRCCGRFA